MEFGRFVTERILRPLGMNDSGFWVEPGKLDRLAQPQVNPATGKRMDTWPVEKPLAWAAGGHGLVSTANDYARFCQMLLNGGVLDGVRLLSRESVELMRRDHLPASARIPAGVVGRANIQVPSVDNGYGFGLGMAVRIDPGSKGTPGSMGDFTWSGAWGTYFWVDPKERLIGIFMIQAPGPLTDPYKLLIRQQVYGGLK
jgi:CubicO group peptidase (beta-lactamase class C family)